MSVPFSRSLRALGAEGAHGSPAVLGVAAVLLFSWVGWSVLGRVTVWAVTPDARVEVAGAAHPVTTRESGQVRAVNLALGRVVAEDQVLVELDSSVQERAVEEAWAHVSALEGQLAAIAAELATARGLVGTERASGDAAVAEVLARVAEAEATARSAEERLARLSMLGEGTDVSEVELSDARARARGARAAADALGSSVSREGMERRGASGDREARVAELEREAATAEGERATALATLTRLEESVERRLVRAPVRGRVAEMSSLAAGAFLAEGALVATIVPEGELKIVAGYPPQISLGRVRVGQTAHLRLDGFPWTWYGTVPATVTAVGDEVREGVVRVELAPQRLEGGSLVLEHGLPGSVEIAVEEVAPYTLLLRAAGQAMNQE